MRGSNRWGALAGTGLAGMLACASPAWGGDGNAATGAQLFRIHCRQCHQVGPMARNSLGPVLTAIIDRKAAAAPDFPYSPALRAAGAGGWVWTRERLLAYLAAPRTALPGTRMAFTGLPDAASRRDLVAYLQSQSQPATK